MISKNTSSRFVIPNAVRNPAFAPSNESHSEIPRDARDDKTGPVRGFLAAAITLLCISSGAFAASVQKLAVAVAHPTQAPILAAAHVGARVVAVGDHGVVLLSDDSGKTFRQAKNVPTQTLLTSLSFIDDKQGWAAGHDGVILHSTDGGDSWALQHEDTSSDKPLFAIHFSDAQHGFAVGLFGNAVQTADGGASWTTLTVETVDEPDHHLYGIFGDDSSALYIAGEAGLIYRSTDRGATWATIKTSNPGSFWAGLQLKDGSLLAVGQRGHIFGSADQGATWNEVPSGTQQSLTNIVQLGNGNLLAVGLAGTTLQSSDAGKTFTLHERADRAPLTAAVTGGSDAALLFGANGAIANP
jgi:photosystem II stability/assembly factor-like uncharacterized protein